MEFTNSEINEIICEIFGCNDHPLPEEEVSLTEIYADIDHFVEVDGFPWYEWVWYSEPEARRQSTLSDYRLGPMFAGLPRAEWCRSNSVVSSSSTLSHYDLGNMFAGLPRAEWCRSNSVVSSSSTLSHYDLGNMFEGVPRCQWQRRRSSTGTSISDPDAHPLFAFIDPVTWPDARKRSKNLDLTYDRFSLQLTPGRSEASTLSDYGLKKLFIPNNHYDEYETLSSYNLELLFNDDDGDDEENETLSCYCLEPDDLFTCLELAVFNEQLCWFNEE